MKFAGRAQANTRWHPRIHIPRTNYRPDSIALTMERRIVPSVEAPRGGNMVKWVTRRDVDGKIVSQPELCLDKGQAVQASTRKTVDECIASLLEPHEIVEGRQALRKIFVRGDIAGF